MKRLGALILTALTSITSLHAQWTDYLAYGNCTMVAAPANIPVAGSSSALFYYDEEENYLGKINKVNHLTATTPTAIMADGSSLVIGYNEGDIDIFDIKELSTTNIPELRLSSAYSQKSINAIVKNGNRYYCGFSLGILEIDKNKKEIRSTWKITTSGISVADVCVAGGYIYAATADGIYKADLSSNILEYSKQWQRLTTPSGNIQSLEVIDDVVYAIKGSSTTVNLYRLAENDTTQLSSTITNYRNLTTSDNNLIIARTTSIDTYDANLTLLSSLTDITTSDGTTVNNIRAVTPLSDGRLALADYSQGLILSTTDGTATAYLPNGPYSNSMEDLMATSTGLYATGPGRNGGFNNNNYPAILSILKNGTWTVNKSSSGLKDASLLTVNPKDENEIYMSTWGTGILRIDKDTFSTQYLPANSTLKDIYARATGYVRTDAVGIDSHENLITVCCQTDSGLCIKDKEGNWYGYPYAYTAGMHSNLGMLITSNDNIWIYATRMSPGLRVLNINGTPEDDSDDLFMGSVYDSSYDQFVGSFTITDAETGDDMDRVTTMAEDKDGTLWIGTTVGLLTCTTNSKIFSTGTVEFNRVKVPRNDGTNLADYLLDDVFINDIDVDGANRKWIATSEDGLYLVSANGYETVQHFTKSNSPLLSDNVTKIAVDPSSDLVYILTDGGLQSYKSDAITPASTLKDVKIFPNPASLTTGPGYISITGLEADSHVFITDVSGARVFYGQSNGGLVRWDMRRNGAGRVSQGVYIVWASSSDGTNKAVGKILIKQ